MGHFPHRNDIKCSLFRIGIQPPQRTNTAHVPAHAKQPKSKTQDQISYQHAYPLVSKEQ